MKLKVYTEGKPDHTLVNCLGIEKRFIKNGRYKKGVLVRLSKERNVLGMVDEDPSTFRNYRKDMSEFTLVRKRHNIEWYQHQSTTNKLIVLCPNLENWILKIAKASKVDVTKFNLPSNPSTLHRVINGRLTNFEKLINELISQQNPSILYLQTLLTQP